MSPKSLRRSYRGFPGCPIQTQQCFGLQKKVLQRGAEQQGWHLLADWLQFSLQLLAVEMNLSEWSLLLWWLIDREDFSELIFCFLSYSSLFRVRSKGFVFIFPY